MARDPRAYLWDAAEALDAALRFTAGKRREDYLGDDMLRAAVERKLQNAGEALVQLRKVDPALASRIPDHDRIVAFRHVLVHRYEAIDDNRVWNLLGAEAAQALAAVRQVLRELGDAPGPA